MLVESIIRRHHASPAYFVSARMSRLHEPGIHTARSVEQSWSAPGIYLTEADFIPWRNKDRPWQHIARFQAKGLDGVVLLTVQKDASRPEDNGMLLSVLYNTTSDQSSLGIFDAATLALLHLQPLSAVIAFHAHGIVCVDQRCYSNP